MTPAPPPDVPDVPNAHERARLNAALLATGAETGFWDDHGVPAPRPDDIEDWTPDTHPSHDQGPDDF